MAPSSNQPPPSHNGSSSLNALLQKKAREARDAVEMEFEGGRPLAEASSSFSHAVVDILPRPRTKMNRSQNEDDFDEGDYCPISPDEIKKAKRVKRKAERSQQRQKLVIQKRRVKKKRRVFLQRLKRFSNLAAFFLLSVMIWVFLANPMWLLRADSPIRIHNAKFITLTHITPFLKRDINKPIFEVDPQAIEHSVKKNFPIVEHLYLRRSLFPASLSFTVVEKTPFAAIYASPFAPMPVSVATFESDTNHYNVVKLAPYHYQPEKNPTIPKLVMPAGYRLEQTDWQQIDGLINQVRHIQDLPLQAVEMVPIPKTERSGSPLMAIIHYPKLLVLAGPIDAELNQRIARLPVLMPKIKEMQDDVQAVDLRWSEQITFIKKGVALPVGLKTLSQKIEEAEKKAIEKAAADIKQTAEISLKSEPLKTPQATEETQALASAPEPGTSKPPRIH